VKHLITRSQQAGGGNGESSGNSRKGQFGGNKYPSEKNANYTLGGGVKKGWKKQIHGKKKRVLGRKLPFERPKMYRVAQEMIYKKKLGKPGSTKRGNEKGTEGKENVCRWGKKRDE